MVTTYNRSAILAYEELTDEQKKGAIEEVGDDCTFQHFVVCGGEVLWLGNFIDEPHLVFWDGVYPTSAFSGYYIKVGRDHQTCVVAARHF